MYDFHTSMTGDGRWPVFPLALVLLVTLACVEGADTRVRESRQAIGEGGPAVLAPEVISTRAPEFAATFTPDGSLYFNRASADRSELVILRSDRSEERFMEPVPASFSGRFRDLDPFATPDGSRLYFTSDRPGAPGDSAGNFDTWYVESRGGGWSEPRRPAGEGVNTPAMEFFPSLTREGVLYFESRRDGTRRIYRAEPVDGGFGAPEVVEFEPNTGPGAGNPLIAPDGSYLVFAAELPEGRGGSDLYFVCKAGEGWGSPQPLTLLNSEYADFAPGFGPDHSFLLFTSERPGVAAAAPSGERPPGDIYHVAMDATGIDCG